MDSGQMRTYIRNFSFDYCRHGNQGYNRLLLQLFGFLGHGKSCFINSCKYVVDDCGYQIYAPVARPEGGGKTLTRDTYRLTNNITLVDNRGCGKMNKSETGEIYAQLGNIQPLDQAVTWHSGYQRMLRQLLTANREDRSGDFIAPVFVYSALRRFSSEEYNEIKEILTKARDITKIFPAVVITHETSGNLPQIQETFRRMGVQLIFPLENYTRENPQKIRMKHEKVLKCLHEIIKDVEFRMEEIRNPRMEITEREEILYTFIIEREREGVREETERKMRWDSQEALQRRQRHEGFQRGREVQEGFQRVRERQEALQRVEEMEAEVKELRRKKSWWKKIFN